jgi:hypothetical protein
MNKQTANKVILALLQKDTDTLNDLGVEVYGNKGRMWSNQACITNFDDIKGECNPRLAFNYCTVEHIGCPKCIETLLDLAGDRTPQLIKPSV